MSDQQDTKTKPAPPGPDSLHLAGTLDDLLNMILPDLAAAGYAVIPPHDPYVSEVLTRMSRSLHAVASTLPERDRNDLRESWYTFLAIVGPPGAAEGFSRLSPTPDAKALGKATWRWVDALDASVPTCRECGDGPLHPSEVPAGLCAAHAPMPTMTASPDAPAPAPG